MSEDARSIIVEAVERVREETGVAIEHIYVGWADWAGGIGKVINVSVDARLLPKDE